MGKYAGLQQHLSGLEREEWRPTFAEIEEILRFPLPMSARSHPAWWANNRDHVHALAWMDTGWHTEDLNLTSERITFRRVSGRASPPRGPRNPIPKSTDPAVAAAARYYSWDLITSLHVHIEMSWKPLGRVVLGVDTRLVLPKAPEVPAIYRFRVRSAGRDATYFGETENLARRFGNYRNPGPTQQTNLRINQAFRDALGRGAEIAVAAVISDARINREGPMVDADLSSKSIRRLFEAAAMQDSAGGNVESLNR